MFQHILVPIDLSHLDGLKHARKVAGDLAQLYGSDITYVGVGADTPGALGKNPEQFGKKLSEFASSEAASTGAKSGSHPVICNDPTTELDDALLKAVGEVGADLVVMQSHVPGLVDYIWPSNGGKIAGHAKCSVMVVRGD
ncbi:universal stress protein [Maritimibacter dapengensis]|uniref:Universal stress protein n=1 Tax=Maritimibacter dapengensis TaxID=2836868 RepID=A0ABS6T3S1_9RHOB|nr:universal stress protein [Maritimibacter dapengensis]MBV7379620.1 universal stress protein [Maritimibacter dapengensis]